MNNPGTCPKCGDDASPHEDLSFYDLGIEVNYTCRCGCRFMEQYEPHDVVIIEDPDLDEERQDDEG